MSGFNMFYFDFFPCSHYLCQDPQSPPGNSPKKAVNSNLSENGPTVVSDETTEEKI